MVEIKQISLIDSDITNAFARLIPQLSPDCKIPDQQYLQRMIDTRGVFLFVAYNPAIAGTLTLVVNETPSGAKAWIEDVVVDSSARGQGIGERLINYAVGFARGLDISSVNLTSRPNRVAANELYRKAGFAERDTNVYRIKIDKQI